MTKCVLKGVVVMEMYKIKIMNMLLITCFLYARAADYLSTYVMVSLGAKEWNPILNYFMEVNGLVEGILIMSVVPVTICAILGVMVILAKTRRSNLLITLTLSVILFVSLVVAVGNLSGLAYVVSTVQNG